MLAGTTCSRYELALTALKLVHTLVDDKFIDGAIRDFEAAAPGIHEYLLVGGEGPLNYIEDARVLTVSLAEFSAIVERPDVAAVIFHCMPRRNYKLIHRIPRGKKIFWIGWGYDYYHLLGGAFPGGLVLEGTARKLQSLGSERRQGWGDRVRECVELPRHFARELRKKAALRKIDYFSPVLDSEYALALECNPWFRPSYTCWNYGTVEDDFSLPNVTGAQLGRNILVGNNATAENNHYEAFEIIKKRIDLAERKVIVPLSYGKSPYRDKVVAMGNELLGESFLPLVEYLPKEKYIECLSSCGIVFMNHIRQQALGNILISGLLGAKIFLNSQSPLYNWMRQRGFVVGDAAEIDDNPLSVEECQQNLDVIYEYWGRDKQHHRTSMMVQLALGAAAD